MRPVISASDGSAMYDDGCGSLVKSIIEADDVANLHRYAKVRGTRFFSPGAEVHDWNPDEWDPFLLAAENGNIDALRALAEIYQSDPSQTEPLEARLRRKNIHLLSVACLYARFEAAEYLLSCGPPLGGKLNDQEFTNSPLLSSVAALGFTRGKLGRDIEKSDIENFVYRLLGRGASVCQPNRYANKDQPDQQSSPKDLLETVLGVAAPHASYKLASRLIAEGADIHAQQEWYELGEGDVEKVTALHIASGSWNLEFIQALVENYGDGELAEAVTVADSKGRLPLHWALLSLRGSFDQRSE
ncbi:uncharacterized protein N7498_002249 [Penicillium cinerascens]|uniref:Uncharacterized protein n=1 Tax=Penicillium cinerascens TaxID=70096 RepID=A0A9W9N9Q8_9EURO|nr:uncharacterized protein N7498_002249 [Penicillium cinerascens]KAJ5215842.1 hypothetical protein N7498_002249 [Penicillium cinerascens]